MILGIDLGTGSLKTAVIDAVGNMVASTEVEYAVQSPQVGWSETNPEVWWSALVRAVRELPEELRRRVEAIGLTGQMHSLVLCTPSGVPLRPAILWSDVRSETVLHAFRSLTRQQRGRLANPIVAGMTGPSLLWLVRNEPEAVSSARWAMQPKDWLRLRLTGVPATDPSDASATLLYDIVADDWAMDIVRDLGLPVDLLPPIRPSGARGGELEEASAEELGLAPGLPIAIGAADAPAAALGAGIVEAGDAQLSLGTGAQIVIIGAGTEPGPEPAVHRFRSALPGQHYTLAAMQNAGLALNWVRSVLGLTWQQLYGSFQPERLTAGLVFLPYLSGERTPLMDARVRGAWVGLGLHQGRDDLAASALAGVALAVLDGFRAVQAAGLEVACLRVTGGGSREPRYTQFLCDLLGVPFELVDTPRASARGAAYLASTMLGRGIGRSGPRRPIPGSRLQPRPPTERVAVLVEAFHRERERLRAFAARER